MAEEISDDQLRAQREREAREANQKRNEDRLNRLNNIANQADEAKSADGMEDLSDEAWQEPRGGRRPQDNQRPEREEESDDSVVAGAEQADRNLDEARAAGADDVRVTNGETYYRLIVNGQERWLTLQQLRDTSSKVTAADEYLRQAKESVKTSLSAPPSYPDEAAGLARGRTRELLNRALMGEQEAIDELAQVLERPSAMPDVAKLVDERVDGRLTFREAVSWFDREYASELKDSRLKEFMVWKDGQLAAANPTMDFKERLRLVGEDARALRGRSTIVQSEPTRAAKEQRKASVRSIPQAAGRQVDEADEDDDETYESAITKMAAARGQVRPVIHKR